MTRQERIPPVGKERRSSPRVAADDAVPHATAHLAAGQEVELVNLNADGGLLIRSEITLKPGSFVRLRIEAHGASAAVGGCVQRCRIASIEGGKIQYEAAVVLDGKFPFPLQASPERPLRAAISVDDTVVSL